MAEDLRTLFGGSKSNAFVGYNGRKTFHDGASEAAADWSVRIDNSASGGSALVDVNGGQTTVINAYGKAGNYWYNSPGVDNSAATGDALDNNASGSGYTPGPMARAERDRMLALAVSGVTVSAYSWSQGGTDQTNFATDAAKLATYGTVLGGHFDNVRAWTGNPTLPIFFSMHTRHQTASDTDTEALRNLQRTFIANRPRVYSGSEEYPHRTATGIKAASTGTITAGSNVIQLANTSGIAIPLRVIAPGFPNGAYVSAISANASVTISKRTNGVDAPANATASASNADVYFGDNVHLYPNVPSAEPFDANGGTGYSSNAGYALMLRQQARRIAQVLAFTNAPAASQGPYVSGGSYVRGASTVRVAVTQVAGNDFASGQVFDTVGWRIESGGTVYPVTAVAKVSATALDLTVSRPLYPANDNADLTVQYAWGAMNRSVETQFIRDNSALGFPMQSRGPVVVGVSEPAYASRTNRIVTAMTAASSQPGANYRAAIDARVRAWETAGGYTYIDRDFVPAVHAQNAALINWANPEGAQASITGGTPTFTPARGFTDAGNTSALRFDYSYNPSTLSGALMTQDNASVSAFVTNAGTFTSPDITDTGSRLSLRGRPGTVALFKISGPSSGGATAFTDGALSPFKISAVRRDASNQIGYRNGSSIVTGAVASNAVAQAVTLLLSDRVIGITSLGAAPPDDATMAALYQADLAYLRAVGAVAY